jgi:plastocyanin
VLGVALLACGGAAESPEVSPTGGPGTSVASSVAPIGSAAGSPSPSIAESPPSGPCTAASSGRGHLVSVREFFFDPGSIRASVGQVIRFVNEGSIAHSAVVAGGCSTAVLEPGQNEGIVFSVAGVYAFRCGIHPAMQGTITIS